MNSTRPGITVPESFTLRARLKADSNRSPKVAVMETMAAKTIHSVLESIGCQG